MFFRGSEMDQITITVMILMQTFCTVVFSLERVKQFTGTKVPNVLWNLNQLGFMNKYIVNKQV